jgi:hypothetical protein
MLYKQITSLDRAAQGDKQSAQYGIHDLFRIILCEIICFGRQRKRKQQQTAAFSELSYCCASRDTMPRSIEVGFANFRHLFTTALALSLTSVHSGPIFYSEDNLHKQKIIRHTWRNLVGYLKNSSWSQLQ